jgi:hypothetical protein
MALWLSQLNLWTFGGNSSSSQQVAAIFSAGFASSENFQMNVWEGNEANVSKNACNISAGIWRGSANEPKEISTEPVGLCERRFSIRGSILPMDDFFASFFNVKPP